MTQTKNILTSNFLPGLLLAHHRKLGLGADIGPHVVEDVGADHRELDNEGEEVDGALLDRVAEDVDLDTVGVCDIRGVGAWINWIYESMNSLRYLG